MTVVLAKYEEILQFLKGLQDLSGGEFRQLKDQLSASKRPLEEKEKQQKQELENQEKELEASRVQKLQDLKDAIQNVLENIEQVTLEDLQAHKASFEDRIKTLIASKSEKMVLERLMKQVKDRLLEAKGKSLLSLSYSDQERYVQLQALLLEKKERRMEVKLQLETYRKALGGSGFDFEKAMMYREMIESEKEVLEKMNTTIDELEEKMAQIEG